METNLNGPPRPDDELREEVDRLRLLHDVTLEFNASLDFDELLPRVFETVLGALQAEGGSLWITEGDVLRCRLAVGGSAQRLVGAELPVGTGFVGDVASRQRTTVVTRAADDPRYQPGIDESAEMAATTVMATAMVSRGVTVGAIQVVNKKDGAGVFDDGDRQLLEGLAASAAGALRNAQLHGADKRARDFALLLEISREITATLDLDRVLQTVVNAAARALAFDRGAVGLLENGVCEIRAVAGQETVDAEDPAIRDLAVRAGWTAGRGSAFYLADRLAPATDAERTFLTIFGEDLASADVRSALYLPLSDEEGILGVLAFEAERPEFATEAGRELAAILANQTAVALRNAQLYHQVPLADTWSALSTRVRNLARMPQRRRRIIAAAVVLTLAALVLVRWPLRVSGSEPTLRPTAYTEVRALVPGVIEQVSVDEGTAVIPGTPLMRLRDVDLQAGRAALASELELAQRAAARAAAQGDAAGERIQQSRAAVLARELALRDEALARAVVTAPAAGTVLTPRTTERIGASVDPGDLLLAVGRTDTLELEMGVDQRDIHRVAEGHGVRLRVDALPQRTFTGRVVSVSPVPIDSLAPARYAVRAAVPNPDGMLRPGMRAHARVLTAPASLAGRLVRAPARWIRLLWWRMFA
jgi:GAF domain-containing protein/biotin carboxyl carrier protein